MGLFDRLLKKDPAAELAKAERLLGRGDAARAFAIARRVAESKDLSAAATARDLAGRAREGLVANALERARDAEASDYLEDAAEWLRTALEAVAEDDGSRRDELRRRIGELERRIAEEAAADAEAASAAAWPEPEERDEPREEGYASDAEVLYESLVSMLRDDVAARYQGRPGSFRAACVDLNEGRFDDALAVFRELDDDPIVRLERGRCRLALGEAAAAREDFEAVWQTFGDQPIDRGGELSLPLLWAEAALAEGDATAVAERLEKIGDPAAGRPELAERRGHALVAAGRLEEAREFLIRAATHFPGRPSFPHLLAGVLGQSGETEAAIDCLETSIAPSCASGSCGKPSKHLPSLRDLTTLYLARGDARDLERAQQLMLHAFEAQNGRLQADDYELRARYHELRGERTAAAEAASHAERLRRAGPLAEEAAVGSLRDQQAVL